MKNKMKYEPPKLFAIHNEQAAGAICSGMGSSATNMCNNGSSAGEGCWSGQSAPIECDFGTGVT